MTDAKRPIRVVRIIDRLIYGGPTRNVVFLTEGLRPRGFETTLISGVPAEGEGDMTFWAQENGVEPLRIQELSRELSVRDLVACWKLLKVLQQLKPDLVHTHKSKAGAVGRVATLLYRWCTPSTLLFRPRRVKSVHTFHGHIFHSYYGPLKTRMFIEIERLLARVTDCVVTVSAQQESEIRDVYGIGKNTRFEVVPLGMEFHGGPVSSTFRQECGVGPDHFLFAGVGRLCEVKNFELMIEAFALARKTCSEFTGKLALIGDGHLRRDLENCAEKWRVNGDVVFTGFRSDVHSIYPGIDLAAMSSLNEGTPLTLIEAMSHGRAVLTTEVGGYADILGTPMAVRDGFTSWQHGVSVRSGDAKGYADALLYLWRNDQVRRQMGEAAREYAYKQFSKARLIRDTENLYRSLCQPDRVATLVEDSEQREDAAAAGAN